MKEESLLLLSDLQKLINQVVLIDYTIIILGGNSMAKMGRPKSDDPMNYRFTIRFSNAEQKQLEAYAEKYDLTKGQVLKKGLELLYRQDKHS